MPPPEVLAPAGDEACLRAAVRAGADAVYFGVQGFNARARAANFRVEDLPRIFAELHAAGVKGFVTLNTLVFDDELPALEETVRAVAAAGADAVIVQDLGVVALVKAVAPGLPVHASTQMTCTDAASVRFAKRLGAERVVVARELSVDDIAAMRGDTELEVFVHGALCVSYSGQCLTSEAIGGRSANRGACAQACRLPYDLVVDGRAMDLGERAYLLSPEDLEASSVVPQLAALGVSSLKIEGRLKGPEYVAAAVKLYRAAVDRTDDVEARRADALVTYSRGSGPGFLAGVDHQRLVEGKTCEHRGVPAGVVRAVVRRGGRAWLDVDGGAILARGAGVLVEGGRAGEGECGGRVWEVEGSLVWLGPDVDVDDVRPGRRVFVNDDPAVERRVLAEIERAPHREALDVVVRGQAGAPLELVATSARGLVASAVGDAPLEAARGRPLDEELLRDKLGRLGDTPYALRALTVAFEPPDAALAVSPSSLNRARRALVDALGASARRTHAVTATRAADLVAAAAAGTAAALVDDATPARDAPSPDADTAPGATAGTAAALVDDATPAGDAPPPDADTAPAAAALVDDATPAGDATPPDADTAPADARASVPERATHAASDADDGTTSHPSAQARGVAAAAPAAVAPRRAPGTTSRPGAKARGAAAATRGPAAPRVGDTSHADDGTTSRPGAKARVAAAAARGPAAPPSTRQGAALWVLCRSLTQAEAAVEAGADGVWLDFLALTGTGAAVRALRDEPIEIGVAPPRIRKPGEEKIDRFLLDLPVDALLVRSLGTLEDVRAAHEAGRPLPACIGDFSLNVANRVSAQTVLDCGLASFTPSFDLDAGQLGALLETLGPRAELVVHHPMPLFHTEHCLFASLLSDGHDYKTCGRPCESHVVALRDRVGLDNPVEADVGCRNTVFHAKPQSAATQVPHALSCGVRRFRIELVRETADDVKRLVRTYRALLDGETRPAEVFRTLHTEAGYGVVRGSLRVLS